MRIHLRAFLAGRSCRRWAAVVRRATIRASERRSRPIDLESRAPPCTPTLQKGPRNARILAVKTRGKRRGEGQYLVPRDSRRRRRDQSHRQSCGRKRGRIRSARDRVCRARRGAIGPRRRSRGSACRSRRRRRLRRRPRAVAGPE